MVGETRRICARLTAFGLRFRIRQPDFVERLKAGCAHFLPDVVLTELWNAATRDYETNNFLAIVQVPGAVGMNSPTALLGYCP
jgi:hypothetical protein